MPQNGFNGSRLAFLGVIGLFILGLLSYWILYELAGK